MKINREVIRAKRWRVQAWGWPLVLGFGLLTVAAFHEFSGMEPVFLMPWYFWTAMAFVVAWACWESRQHAVPGDWGKPSRFTGVLLGVVVASHYGFWRGVNDEAIVAAVTVVPLLSVAVAVWFRRWRDACRASLVVTVLWLLGCFYGSGYAGQLLSTVSFAFFFIVLVALALLQLPLITAAHFLMTLVRHKKPPSFSVCNECGYDLRHITPVSCPECGEMISFARTRMKKAPRRRPLVPEPAARVGIAATAMVVVCTFVHPRLALQRYTELGESSARADWDAGRAECMDRSSFNKFDTLWAMMFDPKSGLRFSGTAPMSHARLENAKKRAYFETIHDISLDRLSRWNSVPIGPQKLATLSFNHVPPGTRLTDHLSLSATSELRFRGGSLPGVNAESATPNDESGRVVVRLGDIAAAFSPEGDWLQAFELEHGEWVTR